jgi:hypothetical protein
VADQEVMVARNVEKSKVRASAPTSVAYRSVSAGGDDFDRQVELLHPHSRNGC